MPRYYFHLRDGTGDVMDREGVELSEAAEALAHAAAVARELMHQAEARTRHWQLDVADGEAQVLYRLPFVAVDETIKHLPARIRWQFERLCARKRELAEAVHQARLTVQQSRALVARARGKPYLVPCQPPLRAAPVSRLPSVRQRTQGGTLRSKDRFPVAPDISRADSNA